MTRQSSRTGHELGGCFKAVADLACAQYQHIGSRLDGVDKTTLEECSLWFFLAKKEDSSGVPPKELDMEGLLSNKYDDYTITDGEYFQSAELISAKGGIQNHIWRKAPEVEIPAYSTAFHFSDEKTYFGFPMYWQLGAGWCPCEPC